MAVTINVGTLLSVLATLGGAFAGWFFGSSGSRKLARQAGYFFVDWAGQPARDGVAAVPGVMSRLAAHDQALLVGAKADQDAAAVLAVIQAELRTNHGSSIKDAVTAMGPALVEVRADVALVRAEMVRLQQAAIVLPPTPTAELAVSLVNHGSEG